MAFVKEFFSGIYNLIVGLFVTGKHLGRHAITLQYPKEKWPMPERSRGVVVLLSNPETGDLNCTACLLCMKACPTAAISLDREKNPETKRWFPTKFVIDNTICCFCGLCEESCNFDAIKLTGKYEFSVYDQSELVYDMDKLAELGRDVKYTPRVKKSAAKPAAKPAPKPAAKETAVTDSNLKEKPKEDAAEKPKTNSGDEKADKPKPVAKDKPVEDQSQKEETKETADKPENKESKKPEEKKQAELDLDKNERKKEPGK
jgi:NADH-quinone oxidoreductase subunit I